MRTEGRGRKEKEEKKGGKRGERKKENGENNQESSVIREKDRAKRENRRSY
jgi:hypothetical protein